MQALCLSYIMNYISELIPMHLLFFGEKVEHIKGKRIQSNYSYFLSSLMKA